MDVVLLKGTAIAGTQGTVLVNLVANQSTATIGTVSFLATGTVTTVTGVVSANLIQVLATAVVATAGTLTNVGTAGTALGTVNANLVTVSGTAVTATGGTMEVRADVLSTNRADLTAVPATTTALSTKIDWMYMIIRNQVMQGSGATSTLTLYNGAGTAIGTRIITDNTTTMIASAWA